MAPHLLFQIEALQLNVVCKDRSKRISCPVVVLPSSGSGFPATDDGGGGAGGGSGSHGGVLSRTPPPASAAGGCAACVVEPFAVYRLPSGGWCVKAVVIAAVVAVLMVIPTVFAAG